MCGRGLTGRVLLAAEENSDIGNGSHIRFTLGGGMIFERVALVSHQY
jgi:hypothetical protein